MRAESRHGKRLNLRKADLQRWRETFAEKLRGWGIDAEATREATRGQVRNFEPLWRVKAAEEGRLVSPRERSKASPRSELTRKEALVAWAQIIRGLAGSDVAEDQALAQRIDRYVRRHPGLSSTPDSARNDMKSDNLRRTVRRLGSWIEAARGPRSNASEGPDVKRRQAIEEKQMRFDLSMLEVPAPPIAGPTGRPMMLPLDSIEGDATEPRLEFDDEALHELAETIARTGVKQPVSVRPKPDEAGCWILNFGARRLRHQGWPARPTFRSSSTSRSTGKTR